jgi:hypothetical protein
LNHGVKRKNMMNSSKHAAASFVLLVVFLVSCGCPLIIPEIRAEMSDLVLCKGWDEKGDPIALLEPVLVDEAPLCVCGQLETNQDILLQITWARDRESLLEYREVFSNGPFLSCIENQELEPGNYGVSVMMTKKVLGFLEFSVGEQGK